MTYPIEAVSWDSRLALLLVLLIPLSVKGEAEVKRVVGCFGCAGILHMTILFQYLFNTCTLIDIAQKELDSPFFLPA